MVGRADPSGPRSSRTCPPHQVGVHTDGHPTHETRAAVLEAAATGPDVVVMDVSMPHLNGLKATEALRHDCPDVKVPALTRHADDGYLRQLLHAGASGYVLKQSRTTELLQAIRAVAGGGSYLDPSVAGRVIGVVSRRASTRMPSAADPGLSPREEEILRLVAWGYSNKEIAERVTLSAKVLCTTCRSTRAPRS